MTDYEQLIERELIAYQLLLDTGSSAAMSQTVDGALPHEVQQRLQRNRECLDFLDEIQKIVSRSHGSVHSSLDEPPLPDRIDRFVIKSHLGSGGFGIVFRGLDPSTNRDVAIKIPQPEVLMSRELVERFRREAKAAAQLDHPNILAVYGSDDEGITPYIVMPLIDGQNLAEWKAANSPPPALIAAEITYQLARGVAHAHSRGVLHRDLKPANVLLDPNAALADGSRLPFTPKLMDFGLAKLDTIHQEQTQAGTLVGTTSYMAPEQAEGRNRDISAMSDIFSLGVILYELLTGVHPFRGTTPIQTLERIVKWEPTGLRKIDQRIPADLEAICFKCLEKRPECRYQSANELAEDLQRFLAGKPIHARRIGPWKRIAKWCRRRPATAAVALVAGLSLTALVVISLSYNSRLTKLLKIAEAEKATVRQQAHTIRRRMCQSDARLAQIAWDLGDTDHAISILKRHIPKPGEEDARHFAWWQLWRDYQHASVEIGRHPGGATSVAVASSGTLAASAGFDTTIRLWTLPQGKLVTELRGHDFGAINAVRFSPDATRLVSAGDDGTLRIWDVATHTELFAINAHQGQILDVAYSPDGTRLASAGNDCIVRLWDSRTGKPIGEFAGHSKPVTMLAFHPHSPLLASTSKDGTIRFWDLDHGGPDLTVPEGKILVNKPENWCRQIVFSPEGTSLAASSIMADIFIWSWNAGEYGKLLRTYEQRPNARCLCWPRGSGLIVGDVWGKLFELAPEDCETSYDFLQGHLGAINSVALSQDRQFLISASEDETIRIWKNKTFPERLPPHGTVAQSPTELDRQWEISWTPNYLLTRSDVATLNNGVMELSNEHPAGVLNLYSVSTGKHIRSIPIQREEKHAISPSGDLILVTHRDGFVRCFPPEGQTPTFEAEIPPFPVPQFYKSHQIIDAKGKYALLSWGDALLLVSTQTGAVLQQLKHPAIVGEAVFAACPGKPLTGISTCDDGYLRFWNLETGELLQEYGTHAHSCSYSVALSNDQTLLAVGGLNGRAIVYRYPEMEKVATFSHPDIVMQVGFFNDNHVLVTRSVAVNLWSLDDEQTKLLKFPRETHLNETSSLRDHLTNGMGPFTVSPDGKVLAIGTYNQVKIIHSQKPPELQPLRRSVE